MSYSVWAEVYKKLKAKGYEVYSPGQKEGECERKYIVIKDDGTTKDLVVSSLVKTITIMCYVPSNRYSELSGYVSEVKGVMKEMFPLVRPNGLETPSFLDDAVKAHMISVQYNSYMKQNYR